MQPVATIKIRGASGNQTTRPLIMSPRLASNFIFNYAYGRSQLVEYNNLVHLNNPIEEV